MNDGGQNSCLINFSSSEPISPTNSLARYVLQYVFLFFFYNLKIIKFNNLF